MTTPHFRNSINPFPWRYGFFLIALACFEFSLAANNVSAGALTLRDGLVISGHPTAIQLSAQGSQEDRHQPIIITFDVTGAGTDVGQGTFPGGINDEDAIVGNFANNNVNHGFLLSPGDENNE